MKLSQMIIKPTLLTLTCAVCLLAAGNSYAGKLYKWVDADGRVSYQDQPPPENAKILDESEIELSSSNLSSSDINERLGPVFVYTIENCPKCKTILTRLVELNIPTQERSLHTDRDAQKKIMEQSSGLVAPTVFIGETILVNVSDDDLITNLENAGYVLPEPEAEGSTIVLPTSDNSYDENGFDEGVE